MSLDRAKEALEAAQVCLERSLHQSATSRDRLDAAVTAFSLFFCDLAPRREWGSDLLAMKMKMHTSGSPFLLASYQKCARTWRTTWQKRAWIFSLPRVFSF